MASVRVIQITKSENEWLYSKFKLNIRSFLSNYDNITLIGNFNLSSDDVPPESCLKAYSVTSLIKEATCLQFSNPSCIDLILTNQKNMYKLSNTFEPGISDYHKLILASAKSGSLKGRQREKICRTYRSFNVETFKKNVK